MNPKEVLEFVECSDNLGYCITDKLNPEEISDPVLATYWSDARELLNIIEEYLESHRNDEEEYEDDEDEDDE